MVSWSVYCNRMELFFQKIVNRLSWQQSPFCLSRNLLALLSCIHVGFISWYRLCINTRNRLIVCHNILQVLDDLSLPLCCHSQCQQDRLVYCVCLTIVCWVLAILMITKLTTSYYFKWLMKAVDFDFTTSKVLEQLFQLFSIIIKGLIIIIS